MQSFINSDLAVQYIVTLSEVVFGFTHPVFCASALFIVSKEILCFAVPAHIHLIVLTQGQVLGEVLRPTVTVTFPSFVG